MVKAKGKKTLFMIFSLIIAIAVVITGLNLFSVQNLLKKGSSYNKVEFENQLMADSKTTENIDDLILNRPDVLTTGRLCIGRQRIIVTCILAYKMIK